MLCSKLFFALFILFFANLCFAQNYALLHILERKVRIFFGTVIMGTWVNTDNRGGLRPRLTAPPRFARGKVFWNSVSVLQTSFRCSTQSTLSDSSEKSQSVWSDLPVRTGNYYRNTLRYADSCDLNPFKRRKSTPNESESNSDVSSRC